MTCDIAPGDPNAKVIWYKTGKQIKPSKKYDMSYVSNKATLVVKETDLSDAATYTCAADNRIGLVETDGKLTVLGK